MVIHFYFCKLLIRPHPSSRAPDSGVIRLDPTNFTLMLSMEGFAMEGFIMIHIVSSYKYCDTYRYD